MLLNNDLIKYFKEKNISILTKLNVPIIDENHENYREILGIQKHLSGLKGDEKKIYLRQVNMIKRLIDNNFNEELENGKTRLGIETIISKKNIKYIPELVRQCRNLNIYSHVEVIKLQGMGKNYEEFQIDKYELQELFEKIQKDDINEGYEFWEAKPPYVAGTCYQNLMRIDVATNGDVYPCPGIDLNMGNLKSLSIEEILANKYMKIIRNLENYIEGDCKNCELFKSKECYGGCRGTVFQTLKQKKYSLYECLVASDPSCWRVNNILGR